MSFIIFGHRGAKGTEPENTMRSFRRALECGVDGLEFDVQRSKDGELMVIHDRTLERTTSGRGKVSAATAAELKKLDAGAGERIPTLRELFEEFAGKTLLNVEIKALGIATAVCELIDEWVSSGRASYQQFVVSSFNHRELAQIRNSQPQIRLGALLYGMPVDAGALVSPLSPYSLHAGVDYLDKTFVEDSHRLGLKVFVYTVNEADDFELVQHSGADGVFTDFPDRFCALR